MPVAHRALAGVTIVPARLRPAMTLAASPQTRTSADRRRARLLRVQRLHVWRRRSGQPWRPLSQPDKDGAVPAIVDATSLGTRGTRRSVT
jgi:hypothetical protein